MPFLVSDIIYASLREIGQLRAPGQSPSTTEQTDVLNALNRMLGTWDTKRLNIFTLLRSDYALTAGFENYTIGGAGGGSGGTLNAVRPVAIRNANIITSVDAFSIPLRLVPASEFFAEPDRNRQAAVPLLLYYDAAYPTATLYLYPVPLNAASLELFTWQQFTQFALLTTIFDMPPGYENAIILNLAVRVAPMFNIQPSAALIGEAQDAYESIRGLNAPPIPGAAEEAQASGAAQPQPPADNAAKP
jgi:hypothetical protein